MLASELHRINTSATGIMGVKIGPDGKIWYVDYDDNKVNKIDGEELGWVEPVPSDITSLEEFNFNIYPNPANSFFDVVNNYPNGNIQIKILDILGKSISQIDNAELSQRINSNNWSKGIYTVFVSVDGITKMKKISIQ